MIELALVLELFIISLSERRDGAFLLGPFLVELVPLRLHLAMCGHFGIKLVLNCLDRLTAFFLECLRLCLRTDEDQT